MLETITLILTDTHDGMSQSELHVRISVQLLLSRCLAYRLLRANGLNSLQIYTDLLQSTDVTVFLYLHICTDIGGNIFFKELDQNNN